MSLLALSGHPLVHRQRLLLAVKRAWLTHGKMFAYDPKHYRWQCRVALTSSNNLHPICPTCDVPMWLIEVGYSGEHVGN
jgi:hypothetical protein